MAFGGFGSTGFGATAPASPFGQTATPAFGASPATPFGAQPAAAAPFGAPAATPAFGQTTPATGFGAAATPAFGGGGFGGATTSFGAQAQPASAFGAKPATPGGFGGGFGASTAAPSPFGAQTTPAFGASTPAAGGFGAAASTSPFGGGSGLASQPTFGGAASTSAFGGAATPAFGAASPTPAFGGGGGMFGGGAAASAGTRSVPYQPVNDQDHSTSGQTTRVNFHCISVMPQYNTKSMEELRWEDYSSGCKGNTGGAAPGGFGGATSAFGGATAASPFGAAAPAASSPFGGAAQPAFGSSPPAFGAAAAPSPFGAASTPAFGAQQQQQQQPAFGATAAPAFGASTPAASPFGAATPAFGAKTSSPFGAASATPAFGATTAPTPAFGASTTPAFGATTPGAFGAAPATSQPAFGASGGAFGAPAASAGAFGATTPAFGAAGGFGASTGGFGATPAPFGAATSSAPGAFGSTGASGFGATAGGTSLFGGAPSAFGAPQTSSAFGAASSPSLFGATPSAFGAATPASTGFGTLGGSPSLFGAPALKPGGTGLIPASGGAFSFAQSAASPFGAATPGSVAAATPPGIAQSPYGALPQPPSIGGGASATPNMKVGISQRPVGGSSATGTSSLITPRTIMPRSGVRMRARRTPTALQRTKDSVASSPALAICDSSPASNIFTPRDNPRRLFIREAPPPASVSQPVSSPSPAPARQGMQSSDPAASPATPGTAAQKQTSNGDAFDASNGVRGRMSSVQEGWSSGAAKEANGDSAVSQLPKLTKEDYYMEPSLESLSSMARDDPGALKAVRAFTIGRHGFGQVQWLGLVDVRGLDLDKLVHIRSKALEVYPDDTDKPPVGSGLNKPATVTLQKIYKIDKSTGMPTTDEAAIKKFRRRLIEHSADQESKFVSYNPESGEWVFEVAHFSRYGLDDDDSDEDDDIDDADLQNIGVSRMPEAHVGHRRTVLVVEDEDGDLDKTADVSVDTMESSDSDLQPADDMMMDDTGASSADELAGFDSHLDGASRPQAAMPLAHSLPSNLQLNVEELAGMQSSLPSHPDSDALGSRDALARRSNVMPGPAAKNAWTSRQNPLQRASPQSLQGKSSTPPLRALLPVPSAATAFDGSPMVPPGGRLAALPAKLSGVGKAVSKTQSCVDTGLLLGRSFRVGWGPGGMLVVPSLALNHRDVPHAHVRVRTVATSYQRCRTPAVCPPEEDSDAAAARARARLVESMEVHKRFSSRVADSTGCKVPLRALSISSQKPALSKVCNDFYTAALEAHNSTTSKLEKLVAAHQMGAWHLVLELFSVVDCRDVASGDSTAALEGLRRRGMVSSLLRQLVRTTVQREVDSSNASEQLVMAWLTGHELGPAMAAAASCGDVRLATLVAATAAGNILGAGAASDQLKLWSSEKIEKQISSSRLALYKLLAGDIPGASMGLALDWRRNMGLYMWYGMPATAGLRDVLQAYLQAVTDQKAAPPLPSYVTGPANSEIPEDTWFGLLCLQASLGQSTINDAAVKSLFFPASHTPDPLDHTFNWMLVGVLQDLDALSSLGISPSAHSTSYEAWFRLASSVVAQAEFLGEPHLAIYAACHIPDHPHFSGLRDTAVRKLLMRHAPEMLSGTEAEVADVTQRLCGDLGVPATWVAESMAIWARHTGNSTEQLKQLILAESWDAAHVVLMLDVAPTMLLEGMFQELEALVAKLLPHAAVLEGWHLGGSVYAEYLVLKTHQGPSRLDRITALGSVLAKASTYWLSKQKAMRSYGYADGQRDCLAMALSQIADDCASWAMADAATTQHRFQGPGFALSVDAIPSQHRSYHIQAAVTSTAHAISSLG